MRFRLLAISLVVLVHFTGTALAQVAGAPRSLPARSVTFATQPDNPDVPLLQISGGYGSGVKTYGRVGLLFHPNVDELGYVIDGTAGAGGAQFGFGLGQVFAMRDSEHWLAGVDVRGSITRTFDNPTRLFSRATYLGLEFGVMMENVRGSIGFAAQLSGQESNSNLSLLWSVAYVVPIWKK